MAENGSGKPGGNNPLEAFDSPFLRRFLMSEPQECNQTMGKSTNISGREVLPALPGSWSELSWRQLCDVWRVKMRYSGNPDVARAAALLSLCGLEAVGIPKGRRRGTGMPECRYHETTGEPLYTLRNGDGLLLAVTPRELSQMARQTLPWLDYPYGDPGKEAVKDDSGKVVEEAMDPVRGYVSNMRDAMILPEEEVTVTASVIPLFRHTVMPVKLRRHFALPQVACNNLTWQQYRSLQVITPQMFREGVTEGEALDLQAQFLAHCLVPRSVALLDTTGGSIRLRPHYTYQYDSVRAEKMVKWWRRKLAASSSRHNDITVSRQDTAAILFHICFQCYQTALSYYAQAYPLLFSDDGKKDKMKDALQGEVGTINTIMKYAGYAEQQQVYDSNLPFVLDILNTMAKEAKEIEKMDARIKRKR